MTPLLALFLGLACSPAPAVARDEPVSRSFTIDKWYLHLPVKTGAPLRRMQFVVDKETVREFDIELADGVEPDFWAFASVGVFKGKTLIVKTILPADSKALAALKHADELPDAEKLYHEKHRPLFHFTSRSGWLNEPNGLFFHKGEWHMFYQHNPFGLDRGNIHWGYAVTKDLVGWKHYGIGLYPKKYGDWPGLGSAVLDIRNTSGWDSERWPPLVRAYTSTGRGVCIEYSTDDGWTWTESEKKPMLKHNARDPRLAWYGPERHWVMAVYDEYEKKQWVAFYTSPDLKTWTFASRIEGFYERPDLFGIEYWVDDGVKKGVKWILSAADGKYLVGDFDGKTFKPEHKEKKQLWYGDFSAAQTFSAEPQIINQLYLQRVIKQPKVQIGWAQGVTFPGMPFNQQMTVPVELTLRDEKAGRRLIAQPVKGIDTLRDEKIANEEPIAGEVWLADRKTGRLHRTVAEKLDAFDVVAVFKLEPITDGAKQTVTFSLRGTELVYDRAKQTLTCKHVTAPLPLRDGWLAFRILVDRGSVEVFADYGRVAMSVAAIPAEKPDKLEVSATGTDIVLDTLEVYRMSSAWTR